MFARTRPLAPTRPFALLVLLVLAAGAGACRGGSRDGAPRTVKVAAAADLTAAFAEIGPAFERESGRRVVFSFGSSGLLSRQLAEGAPFDAFASASPRYVDDVVARGICDGATKRNYARGRIALVVPSTALAQSVGPLAGLAQAGFRHVAIANPEHAPYGVAAKQALEDAGVWDALAGRLVLGENVRQTLQLADSGNADAAIVAWSLVQNRNRGLTVLIDESMHRPIEQTVVACTRGPDAEGGEKFAAFLASPAARAILTRFGFGSPSE